MGVGCQRHYIGRLGTGRSREAAVIFLFDLETQSSADLFFSVTLAAIGSYNDQISFQFLISLLCRPWEDTVLLKCYPHSFA